MGMTTEAHGRGVGLMRCGAVLMSVATSSRGHSNEWSGDRQTPDLPMLRGWVRCYLTTSTVQGDKRTRFCDVPPQMRPKMLECPVKPTTRRSKFPSLANFVMASTGCPGTTCDVSVTPRVAAA